jgi:hypothetical protein
MGEKGSAGQISTDRYPGQRATKPRAGSELVHTRVKRALFSGCIDSVLYSIRQLAKGRRAKDVLSHKNYFDHNRHRMQYSTFKRQGLPRGSGIVESAIRRVINLRIKSPGKFWIEENAEAALHLRSYLKAGHWDQLVNRTLHYAVPGNDTNSGFVPGMAESA